MRLTASKKTTGKLRRQVTRCVVPTIFFTFVVFQFAGRGTIDVQTTGTLLSPESSTRPDAIIGISRSGAASKAVIITKPPEFPEPSVATAKTIIYIITPTSRPSLLTRSIFYVLPLQKCFDVHWVIVHSVPEEDLRQSTGPLFRNVFPWITEIFTFNKESTHGNHERNVGIEHVIGLSNDKNELVYFMDDDNTLSMDLCQDDVRAIVSTNKMYYADQYSCGKLRLNSSNYRKKWETDPSSFSLFAEIDTGNWLTPLWLLKQVYGGDGGIHWKLRDYASDSTFFTKLVHALLALDSGKDDRFVRLESVRFHYNELTGECTTQSPWTDNEVRQSLKIFHSLVEEMKVVRESLSDDEKMDRDEVSFHDYVHILHVLRSSLDPARTTATYVEIGVWKGATSILMSRHPLATNVVGIDGFFFEKQREEAEGYRKALQGKDSNIQWIKNDSKQAVPDLQELLNGAKIDILLIDGDHSEHGAKRDFELYLPLVADGGFIVFDDFFDYQFSAGVRFAVLHMVNEGRINLENYDIFGSVQNIEGAGPIFVKDDNFYDWQKKSSNEFVLRKRVSEM